MKSQVKFILCHFFIHISIVGFTQTHITNKDYEVTDDVVKIVEYNYSAGEINYTTTSNFKNGYIEKQLNDGAAVFIITGNTERNFTYSIPNKEFSVNNLDYVLIEFAGVTFSAPKKNFKILKQVNNYLEFEYHNGRKIITAKYSLTADNLIEKSNPDLWFELKTYYNLKGQIFRSLRSKSNVLEEEKRYNYDNNELLKKIVIENFTENSITEKHYEYELDEKGNWIKKIEYELIPNAYDTKTFSTRKLTYKNGKITGGYLNYSNDNFFSINPTYFAISHPDDKVKDCISGDCQNGFGKRKYSENDVYEGYFKLGSRSGKGTYTYANGNKYEGEYLSGFMNGQGKFTFANSDVYEGSFVKDQRAGFGTYTFANSNKYIGNWVNGKQDGEGTLYDYGANLKQEAIYKEGNVVQVLSTSQISETNTSNALEITWKKNESNTKYWLYNNGVLQEGQTFWVDNSLYVHMPETSELYFLENFKTKKADITYTGILIPFKTLHGFWYKNSAGGATTYNNKCEIITDLDIYKYTPNGIDVLLKGKAETKTLLLKNFKNAEINKIYPAEVYKPTSIVTNNAEVLENTTNTEFQTVINKCKLGENINSCIFNKFREKQAELKKSEINNKRLEQNTIASLNAIGKHDASLLFNILFKSDADIIKLSSKLDADVKIKLKAHAQKIKDEYSKTHNNYIPESLKNSVRKQ